MKKSEIIKTFALVFIVTFIFSFILANSILICINNFVKLSFRIWLLISAAICIFIAAIASVATMRSAKRITLTRFSFWIRKNYPKFLSCYFFLVVALVSIKSQTMWDAEEVANILSVQWTIFGLAITIFLVWNVIIVEYIRNMQPKTDCATDLLQNYITILEKQSFSQEVETTFFSVTVLAIDLCLLIFSTHLIHIAAQSDKLFTQNLLCFSFYFTTNSIVALFFDILKPLKKEKSKLLKDNNVSKSEIDNAQAALFAQIIIEMHEVIMSLDPDKYTNEEKKRLLIDRISTFVKRLGNSESSESNTK